MLRCVLVFESNLYLELSYYTMISKLALTHNCVTMREKQMSFWKSRNQYSVQCLVRGSYYEQQKWNKKSIGY